MKTVKPIKKAFIAKVLVLCMVFAMLPVMALSASATSNDNTYYAIKADTSGGTGSGSVDLAYTSNGDTNTHTLNSSYYEIHGDVSKWEFEFKAESGSTFKSATYQIGNDAVQDFTVKDGKGEIPTTAFSGKSGKIEIVIKAVFDKNSTSGGGGGGGGTPVTGPTVTDIFADVPADAWYAEAVKYVYDNGLMAGVGDGEFAPNAVTTRAMVVTVLYRIEGNPSVSGNGGFADVPSGQWYTEAVAWAEAHGIVYGHTDTKFAPNDAMTREQMAAVMFRYAEYKGVASATSADLSGYTDAGKVSPWAEEAMEWANAEGVINGTSTTTLSPTSSTIRAQLAQILMNYCENVVK